MKKITLTLVFLLGSLSLLFGQTYTMTDGSNNSYNTCSGTFVDSGGAGTGNPSQYANSESSVITFCPSTPGDLIQINFSQFETEAIGATLYDFLEYWNANSNAGPADGVYGGALGAFSITSTSPDGCITFEFTSDLTSRDLGWEAVVSCVTPCTVPIANLDSTPVDICGPASINPGSLTVAFDASGSTANAPETVASYEWDFGDGNTQITATSSVNHTYASIEGIYLASVDVVDTNGCRSTNAVTKLVRVMPGPDFSGVPLTYNVACGSSISLTGVVSSQTETQETPVVVGGTVALPDGSGVSYTSSLDFTGFFPNSGPGSTVSSGCYPTLTFDLEHSFSGDLEISLISPTGETVMVYDQHGGGTGFGNCVDGADDNVPGCTATYTVVASGGTDDWTTATQLGAPPTVNGTCAYTGVCEIGDYYDPSLIYNSTNPFSSLDGADLNGSWTLQITDNIGFDDGVIDTWSLTFPASCYTTLETVTPDLVTATWTGGGAVPVGAQSTTSAVVTDPGPDLCPGSATCQGTELTNSPTVGPFAIAGPYTYTLTVVDEFGCEYERDVVVTASCDCLITLDTANNTQAVCENTAIADIEYTVGGDATGATVTGLPAGITGSFSAGVFTISGTPNLGVSGVFNYTVTTVGCTPNLSETGTITINAFPIADAGTDGTITCTTTSIQIGAASVPGFTYSWSPATGLDDATISNPTSTVGATTTYTLTITETATGCTDTDDVTVTINNTLPTADAGTDGTITCTTTSIQIGAASVPGFTYSWSPATGLDDATISNPTSTVGATTTYTLTITETATGCTDTDDVTVTVSAGLPTADAGTDGTITCTTTSVQIGAASVPGFTYSWSPATGLDDATISNPTSTVGATTTYTLTITETATGCTDTDDVTVTVNNTLPTADAGTDGTITCTTTSIQIGAASVAGFTYSWSPATGLDDATISNPTSTVGATTTYTLTITETATGCTDTDDVTVTVNNTLPTADAGTDGTITCTTTSIQIGAAAAAGFTYSWSPATGLDDATISNPTSTVGATTTYTLTITETATGCTDTDDVTVTVSAGLPTADAGTDGTITCTTTSIQIGAATAAGFTYSWSPATGLDDATISNPTSTVGATTTYTLTITETATGCTDTDDVTVTVNNILPTADAGTDGTITCTTTSIQIGAATVAGFTYSWSPATGLDDATISNPTSTVGATTTYTLTITETATGCTDTDDVTVTVNNTLPTADAGTDGTITCTTTSIQIGAATAAGFTYSWSPVTGLDDATISNPTSTVGATTTYTLTITETATGCTDTDDVTVTVNNTLPTADAGTDGTITCTTISIQIGAATVAGFTYSWSPATGLDDATISNPTSTVGATTTYTLTITETATGCTDTDDVTVTVNNTLPTADAGTDGTITCTTTSIQIGSATAAGFTYSWSPATGLDDSTISNPTSAVGATTTYTLTITETATGCTDTDDVTVTVNNTLPTADAGTDGMITCTTTSIQVGVAAVAGFTYSWSPATGLDDATISNPTSTVGATTTYTLTITEIATGCTDTDDVTVTVAAGLPTADAGTDGTITCTTTSIQIGAATVAGFTYSWSPVTGLDDATISNPTSTVGATTTYTLTITETATGCIATDDVTVTVNNTLPTADAGTDGTITCTTTSIQIGAVTVAGFTYSWSPATGLDDATISNPTSTVGATTTYTLTITETATGCTDTDDVTVTVNNTLPTADAGTDGTITCTTTSIQIGAATAAGFTYSWSPATGLDDATISNPTSTVGATTTYTLTITETATGCTNTDDVTVTVNNTLPTADAGTDGTITCTTTSIQIGAATAAGFTYSWSPATGLDDATISNPTSTVGATTTYTLTITETATGCTATDDVTVTVNNTLPTADAGTDGTITCTTTSIQIGAASVAGFTYSWSPATGLDDATISNPTSTVGATTTYTLTITETATGCTATDDVTVTVNNTLPTADAGTDGTITCTTTSIQIGAASVPGFTYSWSPATGLDDATISNPTSTVGATTTYTLTITETATGCTATDDVTVTVSAGLPTADAGTDGTITCTTTSIQIGAAAVAGFTYSWSPATGLDDATISNPTSTVGATTTYTLTITETATGCTDTDDVTVTVNNTLPTADAGTDGTITCTTTSIQIGAASVPGFTYSWSPATGLDDATISNPTSTVGATTTYTLTITETATGCTDTDDVTVTVNNTLPTADAGTDGTITCTTTSMQIGAATAAGFTYSWSPATGLDDATISNPTSTVGATTTYTLTITETATGCTDTDDVTVTVNNTLPTADAGTDGTITCTTTSIQIGAVAVAGFTYSWSPTTGLDDATISNPTSTVGATTTYTLTITETATGCTATDDVTVTVNNSLPTAPTANNETICFGSSTPALTVGTLAAPADELNWYATSTGGIALALNSSTYTPTDIAVGVYTYYAEAEVSSTGCTSTRTPVTLTIVASSNAGTDGSTTVCDTDTTVINLFNLLGGSPETGGTWLQSSGTGGAFAPGTGTFTPGIGATTSTFTYTVSGVAPCPNVDAVITVNINTTPTADSPSNVASCDSYVLPALSPGNDYYTATGGPAGVGTLVTTGTVITTTTTLFVYSETGTTPNCSDENSFVVTINTSPGLSGVTPLEYCDPDADGFGEFDFSSVIAQISGGNPNISVTFYETQANADNEVNPITSNPYLNIDMDNQTIYYNASDVTTNCFSVGTLDLIVYPSPQILDDVTDLAICDDATADGFTVIDLTVNEGLILNGLPASDYSITYYETEANANTATSAIVPATAYTNTVANNHVVWVRVEDNPTVTATGDGCYTVVAMNIIVNPLPVLVQPDELNLCDYTNPGDQVEEFDLTLAESQILAGQNGISLSYHETQSDADANVSALPTNYENIISNAQTIYVRAENDATGCVSTITLTLRVNPLPSPLSNPAPLVACDIENDGIYDDFDLDSQTVSITNGEPNITITYHETEQNAIDGSLAIVSPYINIDPFSQLLWVRAENNITGCYTVVNLELQVIDSPVIPIDIDPIDVSLGDNTYVVCDDDNDGFNSFDFDTAVTPVVLGSQSAVDYPISYYLTEANAEAGTNAIINTGNYTNISNPQTVWVKLDSPNGCTMIRSFDIRVEFPPVLVTPPVLEVCDDLDSDYYEANDGITSMDLTVRDSDIIGANASWIVSYYVDQIDAESGTNPIPDATMFENTVPGAQTIWVRVVDSSTGCYSVTTLTVRVTPNPSPSQDPDDIELCDYDASPDGIEVFDLTVNELYILNGEGTPADPRHVSYYTDLDDAIAGTNFIVDPTMHSNTVSPETIYVRVTNGTDIGMIGGTGCFTIVSFDIIVNPLPIVPAENLDIEACELGTTGFYNFDLTVNTATILAAQTGSNYTVTYHEQLADAEAGTPMIGTPDNYLSMANPQPIYVAITNTITGCITTLSFSIEVNEAALAYAYADAYEVCDDNMEFDGNPNNDSTTFDLSTQDEEVLGGPVPVGQDPTDYIVSYYESQADAEAGVPGTELPTMYTNTSNPQIIYVRVDNNTLDGLGDDSSFCYAITPLTLQVNPLPAFDLDDNYVICANTNGTEVVSSPAITTGLSATDYAFVWFGPDGSIISGETGPSIVPTEGGNYTVEVTDISTSALTMCSSSDTTLVEISQPPVILATVTTDAFADTHNIEVTTTPNGTVSTYDVSVYEFSLDGGAFVSNTPDDNMYLFTDVGAGEHVITVRDKNGCGEATTTVMVMDYPLYFTPNGDGYNDTWNIYGIQDQPDATIYIFDRMGKLLKQISPTGQGWDGTYNGELMPTSDYWFTVEYREPNSGSNDKKQFQAHFTLKR